MVENNRFKVKDLNYYSYRGFILQWCSLITSAVALGMSLIGFITNADYTTFTLIYGLFSLIPLLLHRFGLERIGTYIYIIGLNLLIFYRSSEVKSALLATVLVLILIIAALMTSFNFTTMIFIADMAFVYISTMSGNFTWNQPQDPETGIMFANQVTTLVPLLVVGYVIAIVVLKILIDTIDNQKYQYEILEKTQDQLIEQEKLSSIKVLAGGIAHDFNNLLMSILGNIDLVLFDPSNIEENSKCLLEAENAAIRAKDLTQQLLMFSKKTQPVKIITDLKKDLADIVSFNLRGTNAIGEIRVDSDLWPVNVDKGQIGQVIQNLVINSYQAMSGQGGLIKVIARNVIMNSGNRFDLDSGNYILIEIIDQGIGVPKDIENKLFDPYFTTKQNGSGLGLSICNSIINNHGGVIRYTTSERETNFYFYLPAVPEKNVEEFEKNHNITHYNGKVLIMDDEISVGKILKLMLNKLGFTVDLTYNGQEAIKKYKQSIEQGYKYRFIICDLTVPGGMGGFEAFKEIKAIDPNVMAIVSSGYSHTESIEQCKKEGFKGALSKPYVLSDLSQIIEHVLIKPEITVFEAL